ncbi:MULTISPECIES: RHS repeat-associated core domain-containing protein [Pseudomonas]|nr:RHS repeat-associated core domain-containing protein [Pseudomonas sp. 2hn]QZA53249.1 RHS repeat-associated core domain-containing protein [Pseudomonas sp. 2hn]
MAMNYLTACDQQHSVLATADTARSYPPYGALSAATGPRLAYCGQLRETLTGAYYLGNGHRSYTPRLMRFISPDALSPFAKGGVNAYAYCTGDPINYQDRTGRAPGPVLRRNYTLPDIGEPGWNLRGNMFRNVTGSEGNYPISSSTQTYSSSSESVLVDPSWGDDAAQAWMYSSAALAVGHTLAGFRQMSHNPRAAVANFGAAGVHAVGTGVAGVVYSMGVAGSLPMSTADQWLYGLGSGLVLGAQIASTSAAVHMSRSTPSANGGRSDNSVEMRVLNSGDSSSTVPAGNSDASRLLRENN